MRSNRIKNVDWSGMPRAGGEKNSTLRPRRLSSGGSGFLLTKNRADQPRLSNVVQLRGGPPRVENGNKY